MSGRRDGPPDLRLTGFAAGVWLFALLALYLSAPVAAGVAAFVVAVAAAVWHWWPGAGRGAGSSHRSGIGVVGRVVAAVLLGGGLGAAVTAARVAERDADPIRDLASERTMVRVQLVVSDDPRAINGLPGRPPTYLVPARLRLMWTDDVRVRASARVLVLAGHKEFRNLLPGQAVETRGRLQPSRGGDLRAAVLSVNEAPVRLGRPSAAQRIAGRLRAGLQTACEPLPDAAGGLLPGLVVGDTSRLDPAVEADFRTTGLTHLTAVSGES